MNPYNVLVQPVVSEKSNDVRESANKYTFLVQPKATKQEIRSAVETMFGVKVSAVNTLLTRGKVRRKGLHLSLDSKKKKAVVTLLPGQKIKLFEDQ